ncbi:MAG: MFS transporter [Oscillospiraceae bacterium]|nr:MFS transporter [Oscillospiraceae bacterium]
MEQQITPRSLRRNNRLYIAQAAVEYHINLLLTGSFLAALTTALGISDALTGVLSSVISLGCVFQMLSLLLHLRRSRSFVLGMSVANQLLFAALYFIPFLPLGGRVRIVLFVVLLLLAYFVYYVAHPEKVSWLMCWVEDSRRGIFTANMQIVSLVTGMAFSLLMGAVFDHFLGKGQKNAAFLVCGITILALLAVHTALLWGVTDRKLPPQQRDGLPQRFGRVLQNKKVRRVAVLYLLWQTANYAAVPFYGTYQIKELGFSLTLVSLLGVLGSFVRAVVSQWWGRYGDRRSFPVMVRLGLLVAAASFAVCALAVPGRAVLPFAAYNVLYGISMGAIEIGRNNLIFDAVPEEERSDALALSQSLCGLAGFAATAVCGVLVSAVQAGGNRVLGLPLYAQQLMSILAAVLALLAAVYVHRTLIKTK